MNFNWENFESKKYQLTLKELKAKFEAIDFKIYQSYDKQKYKLLKTRIRRIKTEYGLIIFNRRIYKELVSDKNIALADKAIGINYRSRLSENFKLKILRFISKGKRYQDILDCFDSDISISTISRIFKKVNINLVLNKRLEKIELNHKQNLYVITDDAYINCLNDKGKKQKYRIRVITFNTGFDKAKSKYRKTLATKFRTVIMTKSNEVIPPDAFIDFVWGKINQFFILNDFITTIVGGDGAPWIRNLSKWLGANYVLDKFHAIRYFKHLWMRRHNKNKEKFNEAKKLLEAGNHIELMKIIPKSEKDIYRYFKGNKEGIINQNQDWNIGVSAESDVFHLVKSFKGNGAKIYHNKTFQNMLFARVNELNYKNLI